MTKEKRAGRAWTEEEIAAVALTKEERESHRKKLEKEDPELFRVLERLGGFTQREADMLQMIMLTLSRIYGPAVKSLKEQQSGLASAGRLTEVKHQLDGLTRRVNDQGRRLNDLTHDDK